MNHISASPTILTNLFKTSFAAIFTISLIGCGSETAPVAKTGGLHSEVEEARQEAATIQAELNDARGQAKLLAQKIETLVDERNALKQERDNLRSEVMKAGEKFAAVQTQFSELRARSAEVNDAIESLDKLISGTEPNDTGIAIVPLNVETKTANAPTQPRLIGPSEAGDSNSVFAKPASATDSDE